MVNKAEVYLLHAQLHHTGELLQESDIVQCLVLKTIAFQESLVGFKFTLNRKLPELLERILRILRHIFTSQYCFNET